MSSRSVLSAVLLAVALVIGSLSSGAHAGGLVTTTDTTTGETAYVVPSGVTSLHIDAVAGSGGQAFGGVGLGAEVIADIPVTAGQTLFLEVGGNGQGPSGATGGAGGANGGGVGGNDVNGEGGAGGGGATDIRTCGTSASNCGALGTALDPRLVVAGGGGGGFEGGFPSGGAGGTGASTSCNAGADGTGFLGGAPNPAPAGTGGGCTSGGAGGSGSFSTGAAGVAGTGGDGGANPGNCPAGSGGGGGYYGGGGGGGGCDFGGGGGGSSFAESSATGVVMQAPTDATPRIVITHAATVPGAPTNVVARAGNHKASVRWQAPDDGGDPILDYTVTSHPSGFTRVVSTTSVLFTGLSNRVTYRFTVVARNIDGYGPSSEPSNPVRPHRPRG